jgi:hypothetical protein
MHTQRGFARARSHLVTVRCPGSNPVAAQKYECHSTVLFLFILCNSGPMLIWCCLAFCPPIPPLDGVCTKVRNNMALVLLRKPCDVIFPVKDHQYPVGQESLSCPHRLHGKQVESLPFSLIGVDLAALPIDRHLTTARRWIIFAELTANAIVQRSFQRSTKPKLPRPERAATVGSTPTSAATAAAWSGRGWSVVNKPLGVVAPSS